MSSGPSVAGADRVMTGAVARQAATRINDAAMIARLHTAIEYWRSLPGVVMDATKKLFIPVVLLAVLCTPAILIYLCTKLYRKWKGSERLIAFVPLLPLPLWALKFFVDIHADPTSHNLFPFEIFEMIIVGYVILVVVTVVHTHVFDKRV
jgi:hypothetical protein